MELEECRREIDLLDRELAKILERRMQVVAAVAAYKKNTIWKSMIRGGNGRCWIRFLI